MHKGLFHLSSPHEQRADYGDSHDTNETGPVDKERKDLKMTHDGRDEPREEEPDNILIARNGIVFRTDAGKIFSLFLKIDSLWKDYNSYIYSKTNSNSIRSAC